MLELENQKMMEVLEKRKDGGLRRVLKIWPKMDHEKSGSIKRLKMIELRNKAEKGNLNSGERDEAIALMLDVVLSMACIPNDSL